jgi:hypothetical protein
VAMTMKLCPKCDRHFMTRKGFTTCHDCRRDDKKRLVREKRLKKGHKPPRTRHQISLDIQRAWRMISAGDEVGAAIKACGFGTNRAAVLPLPRPESEIRADLARQLEAIERKFREGVVG